MNSDILIGIVMLVIAGALIFIGLPSKAGVSPRFLRFEVITGTISAVGSRVHRRRLCRTHCGIFARQLGRNTMPWGLPWLKSKSLRASSF